MNRKQRIFNFIVRFKEDNNGNSPSLGEIMKACGISSKSVAGKYLDRLEADRLIKRKREDGKSYIARMIIVIGGRWTGPKR